MKKYIFFQKFKGHAIRGLRQASRRSNDEKGSSYWGLLLFLSRTKENTPLQIPGTPRALEMEKFMNEDIAADMWNDKSVYEFFNVRNPSF